MIGSFGTVLSGYFSDNTQTVKSDGQYGKFSASLSINNNDASYQKISNLEVERGGHMLHMWFYTLRRGRQSLLC
jgi:hypothetical protein